MTTTQIHPQYAKAQNKWKLTRDCVNDDIEANAETCGYIIKPQGMSDANYKAYVNRAVFKNFVGQTIDIQKGAAFGKEFSFTGKDGSDLPDSLGYLIKNVDGAGTSLEDQLKEVGENVFSIGRHAAIVEYRAGGNKSLADSNRAKIVTYSAETIHDWDSSFTIEVDDQLIYVRLVECISKVVNGSRTNVDRIIELSIDENGYYVQSVKDDGDAKVIEPLLGNGQRMNFIPFKFIGADNNKPDVSRVPAYKLATINLAHYRGDADKRTNIHLFSVPTVSFNLNDGVTVQEFGNANKLTDKAGNIVKDLTVGGTAYLGCDIKYSQATTDSFLLTCQDADIEDMTKLGAQIIANSHGETAEAARIRKASGTASLGDMVGNIEDAYTDLFTWCSMMNNKTGQADEFEFQMNKKFFEDRLSPQMLQAMVGGVMANQIPQNALFQALKRDGTLGVNDELTFDDFKAMIEEQPESIGSMMNDDKSSE